MGGAAAHVRVRLFLCLFWLAPACVRYAREQIISRCRRCVEKGVCSSERSSFVSTEML